MSTHSTSSSSPRTASQPCSKQKFKPEPLVIPSTISSFQQQHNPNINFLSNLNPYLHQQSMSELYNSHKVLSSVYAQMVNIYPNTTFLKSPRLVNYDLKKQYTPPPMLSPFRKGPGLFCNSKQFSVFFQIPGAYPRPPQLNYLYPPMNLYNQHLNDNLGTLTSLFHHLFVPICLIKCYLIIIN